jgi:histidine triad (HIT) family protein
MSSECVFCRIRAGKEPASIIYQDERVTAFMDIQPVNEGHVLVIPNVHAAELGELNPEAAADLFRAAHMIAGAIRRSDVRCEAINLWMADGKAAGQTVFHVHLHLIPRYKGDGLSLQFPPDHREAPTRAEFDDLATRIKAGLSQPS